MKTKDTIKLNPIYREISEQLGMDVAKGIHRMFKGQQISFPVKFLEKESIHALILEEYNGHNIREMAMKYNYSEKTIRRIIKTTRDTSGKQEV